MPKQEGQKSKLLTLLRILEQKTDEEHLLNVPQLVELGVRSFLNFSHYDIDIEFSNVAVENVYIADSLMTLSYRAAALEEEQE